MLDRIHFILRRRNALHQKNKGSNYHWTAYIDRYSRMAQYTTCGQFSKVEHSDIAEASYVGAKTCITRSDIGSFCSIGSDVRVGGLDRHPTNLLSTHPAFYAASNPIGISIFKTEFAATPRTIVGHDVWIGANSLILSGVNIATGSVIGAGSVVTKNTKEFGIYAGVPARLIRFRFDETTAQLISESQWWNIGIERIQKIFANDKNINIANIELMLSKLTK